MTPDKLSAYAVVPEDGEVFCVVTVKATPKQIAHDEACAAFLSSVVRPLLLQGQSVAIQIVEPPA
jgi:hypothetical protein